MEYNSRHPLEAITNSHALSMLEILIPYVDYSLKLPLALFIKFHEIQLIIRILQSPQRLSQYGLHNTSNSMTDMLCSLTGMSPEILNMILSFSENSDNLSSMFSSPGGDFQFNENLSNLFQQMNSSKNESNTNSSHPFTDYTNNSSTGDTSDFSEDFDSNIARILSEYDLEQANEFSSS